MKIREIRAKAEVLRLQNTFGLSKGEWIWRIQEAEGNFDTFDGAKPDFLNLGGKRRSVSTLSIPGLRTGESNGSIVFGTADASCDQLDVASGGIV